MSMLAERRRKTKWVINPTKKPLWTTESNGIKFGKELMEKMGWSAGKGLGAKEQGIQEPLKVSYKNDTKGMGFKGNDDDWIEQQDEFNILLNQLRNTDDSTVVKVSEEEKNEIKSLEEKSKQSRARVHYQKFTRGKDLSRYSENDLACILGTNKIKKEKLKTEVVESEKKDNGGMVTSFGVTTINSGSIQDYFKRKWITDKVQSKSVEKEEEEHSCDERPSFSRVFEESKEFSIKEDKKENGALDGSEMNGDSGEKCEKRKKRKKKDVQTSEEEEPKNKRKKTSDEDHPVDEELQTLAGESDEIETENLLGCENNCDSSRKRKKEKRKSKKDEGQDGSEEADSLEVKKKKKKEKKEKPAENGYCDSEVLDSIDCGLEEECPEKEVTKKKKGKSENEVIGEVKEESIEEPSLEVSAGGMNAAVEGEDVVIAKGKKKKKNKDLGGNIGVDECCEKNELGKVSSVCESEAGSKKKKKKKEKQEEMECCSTNQNGISNEIQVEKHDSSTAELQVKKKKKKKEDQEDKMECYSNASGLLSEIPVGKCDDGNSLNSNTELVEIKKKSKKKEKEGDKVECSGISDEIQMEKCDNGSNSKSTMDPEVKKKKKKKEESEGEKVECLGNESGASSYEKHYGENNGTVELEGVKKKKKKKGKQEGGKEECYNIGNEIPVENCEGSNSNYIADLEVKKKKKKKEDKIECERNLLSEISEGECDNENSLNSNTELVEINKRRKKKEKEVDKVECNGNKNEFSNEIQVEKFDNGTLNSTAELEVKKKKRKQKEEDKVECERDLLSEIPEGKCDNGSSTAELEVKKKKKKDKHKTKEENSDSNHLKESCLDEAHHDDINGLPERVQKKKKKDRQKRKDECLNGEQESKESFPEQESMGGEVGSSVKRKEKELGSEGSKEEGGEEEVKGNAEIGATAGIDKVELICQRAAYEHVAGQHRYERVKKMIEFVNLSRFRGSNLEGLDGYGNRLRKCKPR